MKKQKHGFWVFIFSLIPGAGEMYMGFKKQGLSIMLLFWGSIALASITGLGWLAMFLPVIWFYSFFNVHIIRYNEVQKTCETTPQDADTKQDQNPCSCTLMFL